MKYVRSTGDAPDGSTMRAAVYERHGTSDVLEVRNDVARPAVPANGICVRVLAAGINPADVKLRLHPVSSFFCPLPKIPGSDICGIVEEVHGDAADHFVVGDRVFAMLPLVYWRHGAAAEFVTGPAWLFAHAPENITPAAIASLPLVSLTVHQGLKPFVKAWHNETKGCRALVHAASGGVGSIAVQYLKHVLGCHVTATCSAETAQMVKDLGADEVIDYKAGPFEEQIGEPMDVVFDVLPFRYEATSQDPRVLRQNGYYIHVASSDMKLKPGETGTDRLGMAIPEARPTYMAGLWWRWLKSHVRGPHFHYVYVNPDGEGLEKIAVYVQQGKIKPVIHAEFKLDEIAKAHDMVNEGHCHGKVVLHIQDRANSDFISTGAA